MRQEDKELLSPKEVQAMLGCGRTLMYSLLGREIPTYTVGERLIRVRRKDVEEYLEGNRNRFDGA